MPVNASFLIDVDGTRLPDDIAATLHSAYVDDSINLPDVFLLRFRDPDRVVLPKAKVKIGSIIKVSVITSDSKTPEVLITGEVTTLEVDVDAGGTFTVFRGYDHAHRLFRGRRTEAYTQVTASDIATKIAQRAGIQTGKIDSTSTVFDHVGQRGMTDWEFLDGLAREIGYEVTVRDGKLNFGLPQAASEAPEATDQPSMNPLVLQLGSELLRFRAVVTAAEQVKEVEVRGWDVAQKRALVAKAPAKTMSAELATVTPVQLASSFGSPVYVASDIPYGTQAEVDVAAKALAEQIAGAFAEFDGVARGNPKLRAGTAFTIDNIGAPFDGKYTITSSRHVYDPLTGYTTAIGVTGRQDRSLYGLASGANRSGGGPGVVIGQVSDANDPENAGRVTLTFPWLSDDYVSDWARTVQAGAGKDRGAMVVPEVGDEVLVAFDGARRPYVIGGLFNGVDTPMAGGVSLLDSGSGAINRRSMISRRGHRIDLFDEDGKTEGISLTSSDEKLLIEMDKVGTKITVHCDGEVLIEGSKGIVIDSASSKIEMKAGEIKMTATQGVSVDGGSGAVSVKTSGQLSMKGTTATLEGSAQTEVKASGVCSISGSLVKIN